MVMLTEFSKLELAVIWVVFIAILLLAAWVVSVFEEKE